MLVDIFEVSDKLEVSADDIVKAIKEHDFYQFPGFPEYFRFKKKIGKAEEGTVVFPPHEIVQGFPKIRRVYCLKKGVEKHFKDYFYAEEKMNGYNVRTIMHQGKIYAITRKGIICPYTSKRIEKYVNPEFFIDFPKHMLIGEVVGLENPYQMKSYSRARDFGYFIFDIREKETNTAFPVEERRKIVEDYEMANVPLLGKFSKKQVDDLFKKVVELGEKGGEGVVLKSPDSAIQIKYTCNTSTNDDLKYAFKFVFDYGQAFFFRRLVREAFQAYERNLKGKELEKEASELGKSILLPMVESIRQIAKGREVTEDFSIKVDNLEDLGKFVEHLGHLGVKITVRKKEKLKNGWKVYLSRRYPATNDKIKHYLKGNLSEE
ncbi:MAG: RNA ligase [archaeon]